MSKQNRSPLPVGALALLVLCVGGSAQTTQPAAPSATQPATQPTARAECLHAEVIPYGPGGFVVRCGVEIAGEAGRWYGVTVGFRRDRDTPLKRSDGKDFIKPWNNLFLPDAGKARWSDIRLGVGLHELSECSNLPRGERTAVYVVCGVWDYDAQQYLGAGWERRVPLLLSVDEDGSVVGYSLFNTLPPVLHALSTETAAARPCTLAPAHLRVKEGVRAYRLTEGEHAGRFVLLRGVRIGYARDARGHFFEPLTSSEQARELALLPYGGAIVVGGAEQYRALAAVAAKAPGAPADRVRPQAPAAYGVTVFPEPGLGWRVRALLLHLEDADDVREGTVALHEWALAADGSLGHTLEPLILPPSSAEAPGGDDAVTTRPAADTPATGPAAPPAPERSLLRFADLLRLALPESGIETVPRTLGLQDQTVQIPLAAEAE